MSDKLNEIEQRIDDEIKRFNTLKTADLISRADAIEAVESLPNTPNGFTDTYSKACIIGLIEELPSADRPQGFRGGKIPPKVNHIEIKVNDRPQGEWVIRENGNKECSLCGHERQDGWDYFCGYCGAEMEATK